jgi:integrase
MGRSLGKLSALFVARAKQPGLYNDGGNLYLQVESESARSWIFRYAGRYMGLGSAFVVSLHEARELAHEYRKLRRQGNDPIEARRAEHAQQLLDAAKAITFTQCAEAYINAHRAGWRDAKHVQQWQNTIATYAGPIIGALPVQAVDTALVCKVLEPIWLTRSETASRLRGRIESVLDWAKVRGYREGENPARWRGHLDKLFPPRSRVRKTKHHLALPYMEISAFVAELQKREGTAARALEFAILTAARSGEVLGAKRSEFDLDGALWTVPAERMKARKEHRVPLSPTAAQIIKQLADSTSGEFIFPSGESGRPLSPRALWKVLTRMGVEKATPHGFRSTFRDWAAERTNYPNHVVEMALAHTIGDKVEAAYRRGDLFDKRRRLMNEWARFCNTPAAAGAVIQLRRDAQAAP